MSRTANPSRRAGKGARGCWKASADEPLQQLVDDPKTPPLLKAAAVAIAWQTRSTSALGRVITSPAFAPQCLAALLALGAAVETDSSGPTSVSLSEYLVQDKSDGLARIVVGSPQAASGHSSVALTPTSRPIVSAAAVVESVGGLVREARVALTGVWSAPAGLATAATGLTGKSLTPETIAETAAAVSEECSPPSDFLGGEEYRRAMAAVVTQRSLNACAVSLSEEGPRD